MNDKNCAKGINQPCLPDIDETCKQCCEIGLDNPKKAAGEESNSTALLLCQGFEGPCSRTDAKRQRQNTRYENDELNWVTLCPDCMAANEKHWHKIWREYYSDVL